MAGAERDPVTPWLGRVEEILTVDEADDPPAHAGRASLAGKK